MLPLATAYSALTFVAVAAAEVETASNIITTFLILPDSTGWRDWRGLKILIYLEFCRNPLLLLFFFKLIFEFLRDFSILFFQNITIIL